MRHLGVQAWQMADNYCIAPIVGSVYFPDFIVVDTVNNFFNYAIGRRKHRFIVTIVILT